MRAEETFFLLVLCLGSLLGTLEGLRRTPNIPPSSPLPPNPRSKLSKSFNADLPYNSYTPYVPGQHGVATELTPTSTAPEPHPNIANLEPIKTCYFDPRKVCPNHKDGHCQIDERPCRANRDYLDAIYKSSQKSEKTIPKEESERGPSMMLRRQLTNSDHVSQNNRQNNISLLFPAKNNRDAPMTPTARLLYYRDLNKNKVEVKGWLWRVKDIESREQRRERRRKIFIMSTWLEDLLPDPHQGSTWLVNACVDFFKVSFRMTNVALSLIRIVPPPKILEN